MIDCQNPECPQAGKCGGECARNFDYDSRVDPWDLFRSAVRKASQIVLTTRDDFTQNTRVYKGTRHTLNPEWKSLTYDIASLSTTPEEYIERDVQERILDPLFEPVLNLRWNWYLYPPIYEKVHELVMHVWDEETKSWGPLGYGISDYRVDTFTHIIEPKDNNGLG